MAENINTNREIQISHFVNATKLKIQTVWKQQRQLVRFDSTIGIDFQDQVLDQDSKKGSGQCTSKWCSTTTAQWFRSNWQNKTRHE